MPHLIDSHCHLDLLGESDGGIEASVAIARAKENGVIAILCACVSLKDFPKVLDVTEKNMGTVFASIGEHPVDGANFDCADDSSSNKYVNKICEIIEKNNRAIVAIGETGLDYYHINTDNVGHSEIENKREQQIKKFAAHIRAAKETKKPLIVHSRAAIEDTFAILKKEKADEVGGIIHCFTEDYAAALKFIDIGFHIGISGIVTFNKAQRVLDTAKNIPDSAILLESDAPFLAPVPFRGKTNEPAFVKYTAERVAILRDTNLEHISKITSDNFCRLFKTALNP